MKAKIKARIDTDPALQPPKEGTKGDKNRGGGGNKDKAGDQDKAGGAGKTEAEKEFARQGPPQPKDKPGATPSSKGGESEEVMSEDEDYDLIIWGKDVQLSALKAGSFDAADYQVSAVDAPLMGHKYRAKRVKLPRNTVPARLGIMDILKVYEGEIECPAGFGSEFGVGLDMKVLCGGEDLSGYCGITKKDEKPAQRMKMHQLWRCSVQRSTVGEE